MPFTARVQWVQHTPRIIGGDVQTLTTLLIMCYRLYRDRGRCSMVCYFLLRFIFTRVLLISDIVRAVSTKTITRTVHECSGRHTAVYPRFSVTTATDNERGI